MMETETPAIDHEASSTSSTESDPERGLLRRPGASRADRQPVVTMPRVLLVLAITLLFGIAGNLATLALTPQYSAFALVRVDVAVIAPSESLDQIDDREITTQRLVMGSEAVATRVASAINSDRSVQSLLDSIVVTQLDQSRIVRIQATADNPDEAAVLANGFASEYLAFRTIQRDERLAQIADDGGADVGPGPGGAIVTPAASRPQPGGLPPAAILVGTTLLGLLVGIGVDVLGRRRLRRDEPDA